MPRVIPLGRGLETVVDDEDYEWLSAFRWTAQKAHTGAFYAVSSFAKRSGSGRTSREMQRVILDPDWMLARDILADHRNGDTMDNRRLNLRLVGYRKSNLNRGLNHLNKTGYRWVQRRPNGHYRVMVRTMSDGLRLHTAGRDFACPHEAAEAANEVALRILGPDAVLNVIRKDIQ